MKKFLIITADDFGLHESVNDAVEQASRFGVLSAASLMVGAPAAADAIRRAQALPSLRVGLHLVLNDGWPVLAHKVIPRWTDDAGYMDDKMVLKSIRAFTQQGVHREIAAEMRAQFEAFAASGLVLDHVNLHKHFHFHPTLLNLVIQIGRDFGLTCIRLPNEPYWFAQDRGGLGARVANLSLRPWLAFMRYRLRTSGLFFNDELFGLAHSGEMVESKLLQVIEGVKDGVSEVYLHPAVTQRPITASMTGYRPADELAALLATRVRAALVARGIVLGGFSDARRMGASTE